MGLLLQLRSVSAYYGHLQALKAVSLHVNEGEVVALLGANGAGKTTTLNAISGLLRPRGGEIVFDGLEIQGRPAEQIVGEGLVQVPEGRQIFSDLTVRENMIVGAYRRYRRGEGREVAQDIEKMMELFPVLRERLHQAAGTLSGGEQQMLAIARGPMSRPKMLLLDEPSLGLAPALVNDVMRVIGELRARGTTILWWNRMRRPRYELPTGAM